MNVARADRELLTIGAVLALLQQEFPDLDITISKIRFLESEGLVVPARTPTGYRKFSTTDVDRLRYTLRMQRDHFLPLRVIRENLEKSDQDGALVDLTDNEPERQAPADPPIISLVPSSPPRVSVALPPEEISIHELGRQTGLEIRDIIELEKMGVIYRIDNSDQFGPDAVTIGRIVSALQSHGLDPRHLRPAVVAAAKQTELIESLMEPRRQGCRTNQERFELTAEAKEIANLNLRLQAMLILAHLNESH
ncbi:MAG: MerR family transcriptional regulator [Actinomycetes bacterium]